MPVLFIFRALRLFLTGNDQLVVVQADLNIFLVHAGEFGCHFEGIVCLRHTNCRRASPNVGRRRILIESTKRFCHFAPHGSERVRCQLLAPGPQSRKSHLFTPSLFTPSQVRKNIEDHLGLPGHVGPDPAQDRRIASRRKTEFLIFPRKLPLLEKPSPKPLKRTQVPQQARAVAIMPNDLDQATAAAPKNLEITSVRIPLQTLLSQTRKAREHMTTEHTVVRSGKLKRKPFNSAVADYSLTIVIFGFSYARVSSDTPSFAAFTPGAPGVGFN